MNDDFTTGSRSILARAVSAEVRARMAARRLTLRPFAAQVGFASHNYVAIRNRDESPYTLDDLARIAEFFGEEPDVFVRRAMDQHADDVWFDAPADELGERRTEKQHSIVVVDDPMSEPTPNLAAVADDSPLDEELGAFEQETP